jgi:uncharacterized protein (TIGR02391 family)
MRLMTMQRPTSWVRIEGQWAFDELEIQYLGPTKSSDFPAGVALSDISLTAGKISVSVSLAEAIKEEDSNTSGHILFGYSPRTGDYYSAGISAYDRAYVINEFKSDRGWQAISTCGYYENLELDKEYRIELEFRRKVAILKVDGVAVLESLLPEDVCGRQVGLYSWGQHPITFKDYEVGTWQSPLMELAQPGVVLHPVVEEVSIERFRSGHFADAVETAFKRINKRVQIVHREKTGNELDGTNLMEASFSLNDPSIRLADLNDRTGRDIQLGYMRLFAGGMLGIRNPKAHEDIDLDPSRAVLHLCLASLLMSKLDDAGVPYPPPTTE